MVLHGLRALSAWRTRRLQRKAARLLLAEARRVKRRFRHRLTAAQGQLLTARIADLEAALRSGEDVERAVAALTAMLDGELRFAKKSTVRQYAESLGGAVFVALLLRSFVVEAYQIPSGSMIPTLEVGDHIWVNKMIYGWRIPFTDIKLGHHLREPRRGEVLVFSHPREPATDLIKRVVAVGGDQVELRDSLLYVNGQVSAHASQGSVRYLDYEEQGDRWVEKHAERYHDELGRSRFVTLQDPERQPARFGPVRVPEGSLFVLGDNRDNSADSRYWGFVPLNLVRGRAMVVWWSRGGPDGVRWRRLGHLIE